MAPPRPLHCTGAQGPSGAAGQPPQKSNGPSTFKWPMVLPELPLLTLSFAMSALSLSTGLRSACPLVCSVRSHRSLQLHAGCCAAGHGGDEPLQHGAAATIQPQNGISDAHPESLLPLPRAALRARQRELSIAQTFSIGLKSGDVGGSFPHYTPTAAYADLAGGLCRALSPSWKTTRHCPAQRP